LGLEAKSGRILDIGCGPGIHARQFARLGFDVTAIDYSSAMIDVAAGFPTPSPFLEEGRDEVIPPTYRQLDMREIGRAFPHASFDAAWASASLIHVPETDIDVVLDGIHHVLQPGALFHVSLKGGAQGPRMVHDTKYGLPMEREFIFWQEDEFARHLRVAGFDIIHVEIHEGGITGDETTTWLIFTTQSGQNA
jgi:SAM-dependent methyltransferase